MVVSLREVLLVVIFFAALTLYIGMLIIGGLVISLKFELITLLPTTNIHLLPLLFFGHLRRLRCKWHSCLVELGKMIELRSIVLRFFLECIHHLLSFRLFLPHNWKSINLKLERLTDALTSLFQAGIFDLWGCMFFLRCVDSNAQFLLRKVFWPMVILGVEKIVHTVQRFLVICAHLTRMRSLSEHEVKRLLIFALSFPTIDFLYFLWLGQLARLYFLHIVFLEGISIGRWWLVLPYSDIFVIVGGIRRVDSASKIAVWM